MMSMVSALKHRVPATLVAGAGLLFLGCTFDATTRAAGVTLDAQPTGDDGATFSDAGLADGAPALFDASADAACAFEAGELCSLGAPDAPLEFPALFNTSTDPGCRTFTPAGGEESCLLLVESMNQSAGVTSIVEGKRPLLIAATGDIVIAGSFDISSRKSGQIGAGANHSSCSVLGTPEDDVGGSGGGSGGSFAGRGGNGGLGDSDNSSGGNGTANGGIAGSAVGIPASLRGGCPGSRGGNRSLTPGEGQGGPGGNSGGAVYFLAAGGFSILAGGEVRATGAGGLGGQQQSGGGGGGSGGFVRIDAATTTIAGMISANGGGGGEGGVRYGSDSNIVFGNDGEDGQVSASAAAGGSGASDDAGDGGDGSSQGQLDGQAGGPERAGAGGGGGAAGFILVKGQPMVSAQVSPAITLLD